MLAYEQRVTLILAIWRTSLTAISRIADLARAVDVIEQICTRAVVKTRIRQTLINLCHHKHKKFENNAKNKYTCTFSAFVLHLPLSQS